MPSKVWLLAKMINIDRKTVFRPQVTDMIKKIGHFYPHIFTYLFNKYLLSSFRVLHIILGTTYVTVNKTEFYTYFWAVFPFTHLELHF